MKNLLKLIFVLGLFFSCKNKTSESYSPPQEGGWLTQLGAITEAKGGHNFGSEGCSGVSVDSSGNVYCAGYTSGDHMGEASGGRSDAFIMKLDPNGKLNP